MRACIVGSFERAPLDATQWNTLAAHSDTNSVFQTHQWTTAWWSTFGDQYSLRLVLALEESTVVGVAPFFASRNALRESVLRFVGDGRADYCDILTSADKAGAIRVMFEAIFAARDWDVIELNNIPSTSTTVENVRKICQEADYGVMIDEQFVCPTLIIEGHEEDVRGILNKASLRRRENAFQRRGGLVRRDLTEAAAIIPHLEAFFAQHIQRWETQRMASLFLNERNRQLYRTLTANMGETGWLLFSIIELVNEPIAFHFGFDYNGSVTWYKPSFDPAHASSSPGLVLVRHLIGYALHRKRRELDFTIGDEAFKRRFTNATRNTVRVRVFRKGGRFALESARRRVVNAAKKLVR
jgi:CelD/BcsL family acetyltransferase involved in cellulose biosynthesis